MDSEVGCAKEIVLLSCSSEITVMCLDLRLVNHPAALHSGVFMWFCSLLHFMEHLSVNSALLTEHLRMSFEPRN